MPVQSMNSYDCFNGKPVSVIASYNAKGDFIPIYVKINGEVLKIVSAVLVSSVGRRVYKFRCEIQDGQYIKNLHLTYFKEDSIWMMPWK